MKSNISSLELKYLLDEIKVLIGGKVDRIYHPKEKELFIVFHVSGEGKKNLRLIAGKLLYLTNKKPSMPEASSFCGFLRNHLNNAKIKNIEQLGSERIVKFTFETFDGKQNVDQILIVELYGSGNFILCDSENNILGVEENQKWQDRTIRKGEKYAHEYDSSDYNAITLEELKSKIKNEDEIVVKLLATKLGLGGTYSEELCLISKLDKNKIGKELKDIDVKKIHSSLKSLLDRKIKPNSIKSKDDIKDIVPFEMEIYKDFEKEFYDTYNDAFDCNILIEVKKDDERLKKFNEKAGKMMKIIEAQEGQLVKANSIYLEDNSKGNVIYENYVEIDEFLVKAKKLWKEKGYEEVVEKLKDSKKIKKIKNDGKIIVEF